MRRFFIFLSLIGFLACFHLKSANAKTPEEILHQIEGCVWISENWLINPNNPSSFFRYHTDFQSDSIPNEYLIKVNYYIEGQTNNPKCGTAPGCYYTYQGINPKYFNSGYIFYSGLYSEFRNEENDIVQCVNGKTDCLNDEIFIYYKRLNKYAKVRLNPDGTIIKDGIKYIRIPYEQFDAYFDREIAPGPPAGTVGMPLPGAEAEQPANVADMLPKEGDKPQEETNKAPKEPAKKRQTMLDNEEAVKRQMQREREAIEEYRRALKRQKPYVLDPRLDSK